MSQPTNYNEQLLLQQTAAGDEAAFTTLFYIWQPRLGAFLYKLTESRVHTEEILHDVFLKLWQGRETLAVVTSFKSYLFVIARNHALNELNKLETRLRHEKLYQQDSISSHQPEMQDFNQMSSETLIDEALAQLSERQREVWMLSRLDRLTYKQIAAKLGISAETVKTHLQLATASITAFVRARQLMIALFAAVGKNIFE